MRPNAGRSRCHLYMADRIEVRDVSRTHDRALNQTNRCNGMKRSSLSGRWIFVRPPWSSLLLVILLPALLSAPFCLEFLQERRAQAWDGTGHYALAQIYNQSIFPETFGWTNGY